MLRCHIALREGHCDQSEAGGALLHHEVEPEVYDARVKKEQTAPCSPFEAEEVADAAGENSCKLVKFGNPDIIFILAVFSLLQLPDLRIIINRIAILAFDWCVFLLDLVLVLRVIVCSFFLS